LFKSYIINVLKAEIKSFSSVNNAANGIFATETASAHWIFN